MGTACNKHAVLGEAKPGRLHLESDLSWGGSGGAGEDGSLA